MVSNDWWTIERYTKNGIEDLDSIFILLRINSGQLPHWLEPSPTLKASKEL